MTTVDTVCITKKKSITNDPYTDKINVQKKFQLFKHELQGILHNKQEEKV